MLFDPCTMGQWLLKTLTKFTDIDSLYCTPTQTFTRRGRPKAVEGIAVALISVVILRHHQPSTMVGSFVAIAVPLRLYYTGAWLTWRAGHLGVIKAAK